MWCKTLLWITKSPYIFSYSLFGIDLQALFSFILKIFAHIFQQFNYLASVRGFDVPVSTTSVTHLRNFLASGFLLINTK